MKRRRAKASKAPVGMRAALQPFGEVKLPDGRDGEYVWFYVGKWDGEGRPPPLTLEDFRRVRRALGL